MSDKNKHGEKFKQFQLYKINRKSCVQPFYAEYKGALCKFCSIQAKELNTFVV